MFAIENAQLKEPERAVRHIVRRSYITEANDRKKKTEENDGIEANSTKKLFCRRMTTKKTYCRD